MRVLAGIGLVALFVVGAVLGTVIGAFVFVVSAVRGARAVHAEGAVCRAEVIARDSAVGPRIAGPALVRLSGAFEPQQSTTSDVLGIEIRLQRTRADDPRVGDQDLLLASFESFLTAKRDRERTNIGDYLGNRYSSVTPWWIPGVGPKILRLDSEALPADRGANRIARLDSDLEAGRAMWTMTIDGTPVAEVRLIERLAVDDRGLRASMMRQGRGVRPVGLRNGIRSIVYPLSQTARRLRGG